MDNFYDALKAISQRRAVAYPAGQLQEIETELQKLIRLAESNEQKFDALSMLADHFHFVKEDTRALNTMELAASICPDRVEAWLALAEHFHYYQVDLDEAAKFIEIALDKAEAENCLVRQVLGARIRIAIARNTFERVNDSLARLNQYRVPINGLDVALERDFVSKIPEGLVDSKLLEQYKKLLGPEKSDNI